MGHDTAETITMRSPGPNGHATSDRSQSRDSERKSDVRYLEFIENLSRAQEPELLNEKLLESLIDFFGLSRASLGLLYADQDHGAFQQILGVEKAAGKTGSRNWDCTTRTIKLDSDASNTLLAGQPVCIKGSGAERLLLPVGEHDKQHLLLYLTGLKDKNQQNIQLASISRIYYNLHRNLDQGQRDKLTGLLNRQTFDSKLDRMLENQRRQALSYAANCEQRRRVFEQRLPWLAIIDIDHFKRVNDRFGHVFGDEVILSVGQHIRACFRKSDLMFRFGGEEFVVVLEPIPANSVMTALERLRLLVARQELQNVGQVTVSIGYAAFTDNAFPPRIIDCADQALYYAKENGRNQIASYEDLITRGELTETQYDNGGIDLF